MKLLLTTLFLLHYSVAKDCELRIKNDIKLTSPLLLQPGEQTGINAFYLPDNNGIINIATGVDVNIACTSFIVLSGVRQKYKENKMKCVKNDEFEIENKIYKFKDINCLYTTDRSIKDAGLCRTSHNVKQIGYALQNRFLDMINVCFDTNLKTPIYTSSVLYKSIDDVVCKSVDFTENNQYNLPEDVKEYYKVDRQRATINSQVHLSPSDETYVTKDNSLTKGHLIAKADFMYPIHQRCTFFFINSVPQWRAINEGGWSDLEKSTREVSINKNINLDIVAGGYSILQLKDSETGHMEDIYLYKNGNNKALPVPKFVWRFIYNEKDKTGVVMVSTNTPVPGQIQVPCNNVCNQITWVKIDPTYISCCAYSDFQSNFDNVIPPHTVNGLFI